LALTIVPLLGLFSARKSFKGALPDLIFGAIDTGILVIPALCGGIIYGVAGAIAGGVIGDALTDGIAGFFEGSIAKWLREKGFKNLVSQLLRLWVRWRGVFWEAELFCH
jgi:hypothetical protein